MRILLWTHNSFALGHIYRSCAIARSMRSKGSDDIIVVSGARFSFNYFLPDSIEVVKVPSFSGYVSEKGYEYMPAALAGLSKMEITQIRSQLISCLFKEYWPDVFIVDHQPTGLNGELYNLIYQFRLGSHKWKGQLILGTRGIIDSAISGEKYLQKHHGIDVIKNAYDQILVYSDKNICNFVNEYSLPKEIEGRVVYVGYVNPNVNMQLISARNEGSDVLYSTEQDNLILIGAGGGRDGYNYILKAIEIVSKMEKTLKSLRLIIITGPYMPDLDTRFIKEFCKEKLEYTNFKGVTYVDAYIKLMKIAKLFIGMGGYNTLVQLLDSKTSALILPRTFPESEQLIHSQRIAKHVDFIRVDDGTKDINELAKVCLELFLKEDKLDCNLDLAGAEKTATLILGK